MLASISSPVNKQSVNAGSVWPLQALQIHLGARP
jgi:hypothetical protein